VKLLLIRHPKPDVPTGLCYGATDVPLPDGWQEQSLILQSYLDDRFAHNKVAFYHSPLSRAAELSQLLSRDTSSCVDALKELDFGEWENQFWNMIPKEAIDSWMEDLVQSAPYRGESLQSLANRVAGWWQSVQDKELDACVAVTHSGVIKVLVSLLCQWPLAQCHRIDVGFNSVTELTIRGEFITLNRLGAGDWVPR